MSHRSVTFLPRKKKCGGHGGLSQWLSSHWALKNLEQVAFTQVVSATLELAASTTTRPAMMWMQPIASHSLSFDAADSGVYWLEYYRVN